MQIESLLRHSMLSSLACLAVPHLIHISYKRYDFSDKKVIKKSVFRFSLQLLSQTFLILRRIQREVVIIIHMFSSKVDLRIFIVKFLDRVFRNPQISNDLKISLVGNEVLQTSRRNDRHDEANDRFP